MISFDYTSDPASNIAAYHSMLGVHQRRSAAASFLMQFFGDYYKSSGVRPVCFEIRASIFGPISS
jgi:hypothetical protein